MNRIYLILTLLTASLWASAQDTLHISVIPMAGDTVVTNKTQAGIGPDSIARPATGRGIVWDYSHLHAASKDSTYYSLPSATPYAASIAGHATLASRSARVPGTFNFFNYRPDYPQTFGFSAFVIDGNGLGAGDLNFAYSNDLVLLKLPAAFGDVTNSSSYSQAGFRYDTLVPDPGGTGTNIRIDSVRIDLTSTSKSSIIGTGILKLPNHPDTAAVLQSYTQTSLSTFEVRKYTTVGTIRLGTWIPYPFPPAVQKIYSKSWFVNGIRGPILTFNTDSAGSVTDAAWQSDSTATHLAGLKTGKTVQTLNLYPNPSNGRFTVNLPGESAGSVPGAVLTVTDAAGRTLLTRTCNTPDALKLDLEPMPAGMYRIALHTSDGMLLGAGTAAIK